MAASKASILEDVTPAEPIDLRGDILFKLPRLDLNTHNDKRYPYVPGSRGYACNSHCSAALFTPGVTIVTLALTEGVSVESRTYRLEKRPGCRSNVDVSETALMPPLYS